MALLFLALAWTCIGSAQEEMVIFSSTGGFYEDSFQVDLYCFYAEHHIRYTTNGGTPDATSTLYTTPLTLNEELFSKSNIHTIVNCIPSIYHKTDSVKRAIVIRAAVFDENDSCISPVTTNSYFIRSLGCDTHGLPVLSIAADSLSLFDYETGIFIPGIHYDPADSTHTGNYCQRGREWERLVNMEFYETDNTGVNQRCGLRIHGGASRWFQQKGMRLYAREEYGKKKFKHQFFESVPIEKYKRLNLHPFRCSHWLQTGGQEYISQTIAANLNIDVMGVRQTVVFINGEYWGIYTLEESPDERYLESHYNLDLEKINILKYWGVPQHGDPTDWREFYLWIKTADLSQSTDVAYAYSRIDVPNFIDYMLFGTYTANLDWPQNNVLHWQGETGSSFRWLLFDCDGSLVTPYFNAIENAKSHEGSGRIFNHFLESESFRKSFYQRYTELLNTTFGYHYLHSVAEEYRQLVEGEIEAQSERFGFPKNLTQWYDDMDKIDAFFLTRDKFFQQEIIQFIFIEKPILNTLVCVPNPSSGTFHIKFQSSGNYIMPLEIYDVNGHLVYHETLFIFESENDFLIETTLRSGLYLVRINDITIRIIIQ